jgi:hypothetical protein
VSTGVALGPTAVAGASQAPGTTIVLPGQTPDGGHILAVLLKRTYTIVPGGVCSRAETDRALVPGDAPWGNPLNSSIRHESDFVPFKLGTDVVVNGTAYAPRGEPTTSCRVAFQVADRRKEILVIGDRGVRFVKGGTPAFTDPAPFESMPIRYERAYGGIDVYSDKKTTYPYPRNPLGRGFAVTNCEALIENLELPNLEDPGALLTSERLCIGDYAQWTNQPFPAGLGWFPKTWLPRAQLAGILPADRAVEQELRQAYAKLVPAEHREAYLKHGLPDMDFRFFNGASRGLAMPFLTGAEQIVAENLAPEGLLSFRLPGETPRIALDIGSGPQEPQVVLHTVMVRMDERQVDLVWRGAVPYAGRDWLPEMRKMEVHVA